MTGALIAAIVALGIAVAILGGLYAHDHRRRTETLTTSARRILFPFTGHVVSRRALDAALRLALAENATLVPVFLARVPLQLPLNSPLPKQCTEGMPLLETIEQRAAVHGVPVDSRIERGRTLRHAMREAIAHERFDRLVVAAASVRSEGFQAGDVAWLLDNAPGEVVIIRAGDDARLNGPRRAPAIRRRRRSRDAPRSPAERDHHRWMRPLALTVRSSGSLK